MEEAFHKGDKVGLLVAFDRLLELVVHSGDSVWSLLAQGIAKVNCIAWYASCDMFDV